MENIKTYYKLLFGHQDIALGDVFYPTIPKSRANGEDNTIPRLCVCPTLDDCVTAIGLHRIGIEAFLYKGETEPLFAEFPFTVLSFLVNESEVLPPEDVAQYVPDALITSECWIMEPTAVFDVQHLWLVNGAGVCKSVDGKGGYCYGVKDTVWSKYQEEPRKSFLNHVAHAVREYLMYTRSADSNTKICN